jgi:hypothetical protein
MQWVTMLVRSPGTGALNTRNAASKLDWASI